MVHIVLHGHALLCALKDSSMTSALGYLLFGETSTMTKTTLIRAVNQPTFLKVLIICDALQFRPSVNIAYGRFARFAYSHCSNSERLSRTKLCLSARIVFRGNACLRVWVLKWPRKSSAEITWTCGLMCRVMCFF